MAVIPTYNEAANIECLLREILRQGPNIGAVVVDDNSPDGTAGIVERLREEDPRVHLIVQNTKRGRGTAGIAGFQYALNHGVPLIIEMDADFSHQPFYIPFFLSQMDGCDLIIASRLIEGGGDRRRHFLRKWITRLANAYIRLVLGPPIRDCTSGYRVFRREVLETIDLSEMVSQGPSIVEEVLYKAYKQGFRVKEVPYVFEERKAGKSTFNWRIAADTLKAIARIRWIYRHYPGENPGKRRKWLQRTLHRKRQENCLTIGQRRDSV